MIYIGYSLAIHLPFKLDKARATTANKPNAMLRIPDCKAII